MDLNLYNNIIFIIKIVIIIINIILFSELYIKNKSYKKIELYLMIFFSIIYIIIFTFRPVISPSDTEIYLNKYVYHLDSLDDILKGNKDIFFYIYSYITKIIYNDKIGYLFFMALTYFMPLIFVFKNFKHSFLLFSLFTFTISFENLGTNIIRQGLGLSFFTLAVVLFFNQRKKAYIIFLLSFLFHISLLIPILIFFICNKMKDMRISLTVLICCSMLSLINMNVISFLENIPILSNLFKERNEHYIGLVTDYKVGFRPDFFIFNYFFILIGTYTYFKYRFNNIAIKEYYLMILNLFCILSSLFFLMFTQPYSDRYGVLSWQLIPLLFLPYIVQPKIRLGIVNSFTLFLIYSSISLILNFK